MPTSFLQSLFLLRSLVLFMQMLFVAWGLLLPSQAEFWPWLLAIWLIMALGNLLFLQKKFDKNFLFYQIFFDSLFLSFFSYLTGGIANALIFILIPYLMLAAFFLDEARVWILTITQIFLLILALPFSFVGSHTLHIAPQHLWSMWIALLFITLSVPVFFSFFQKIIKTKNDELQQAAMRLAKQQHLVTLGTLAASVAHDLRTPLNTLWLLNEMVDNVQLKSQIEQQIEICIKRLKNLNQNQGNWEAGNGRKYLVKNFLHALKEDWQKRFPNANLITDWHIDQEIIYVEPALPYAIFNILDNAAQASPQIFWRVYCQADQLIFAISDQGNGLPEAVLNAQEPLTEGSGLGLGLYLSKQIINHFDGQIAFAKSTPVGLTVTITLPCYK
jgi:two-component system sensor histidine kinase RegB